MNKIKMINIAKKQVLLIVLILLLSFGLSSCNKIEKVENNREFPNTVAENAIVSDKYSNIANQIKDFAINEYMDNISKIPRESGDDEKILNYIYNWAKNHNITVNKASNGCVYYDVPATQGCENFPNIILQAHVDMVNTKLL